MSSILPINVGNLLRFQGVESARVEFKASWDEDRTGYQVLKTICAFANDLHNLNGGYIVIGVQEDRGVASLPPKGILPSEIDPIQKWVRGNCNRIDPPYQPVFSPEVIDGKNILIIWIPASDVRPHKAPGGAKSDRKYFVRLGSESVDAASNGVEGQLLQMTARVPFDDRREQKAQIEDMRETKVREFLRNIGSGLIDEKDTKECYRKLKITATANGREVPKNIGLLLFSEEPEEWFRGAHIEIVQYAGNISGNVIEEKIIRGGIHEQLQMAFTYLENITSSHLEKQDNTLRVKGWISYPLAALREVLVNAVYHRSYEAQPEPVKIYLYPDRIEVISYPGPVHGIEQQHLQPEAQVPPVPARNRRIGEFLKELRLAEGRGTGLPKLYKAMRENGSPNPRFDFDEGRTYFRATLPAHPEYVAISALRDAAHLRAIGNEADAFRRIEEAWQQMPASPSLTAEMIRLLGVQGKTGRAETVFSQFKELATDAFIPNVTNVLIDVLLDADRKKDASALLDNLSQNLISSDALDVAILARRLGRPQAAHRYFEQAGDALFHDPRALHEFSQTKIELAQNQFHGHKWQRGQRDSRQFHREENRRLLREAKELLERVVRQETDRIRHAWAWRDLGRVKKWLKFPESEVKEAYGRAIELLPGEQRFKDELSHSERGRKR